MLSDFCQFALVMFNLMVRWKLLITNLTVNVRLWLELSPACMLLWKNDIRPGREWKRKEGTCKSLLNTDGVLVCYYGVLPLQVGWKRIEELCIGPVDAPWTGMVTRPRSRGLQSLYSLIYSSFFFSFSSGRLGVSSGSLWFWQSMVTAVVLSLWFRQAMVSAEVPSGSGKQYLLSSW